MKVSPLGTLIAQWGTYGSKPGEFDLPSSVGVDARNIVHVSDVRNHRIETFSPSGRFLRQWQLLTQPSWWYQDPSWSPCMVRMAVDGAGDVYDVDGYLVLSEYSREWRLLRRWHIGLRRSDVNAHGYPQPYAPLAIALGPRGSIYLALAARGRPSKGGAREYLFIQRRSPKGPLLDEWGNLQPAFKAGRPLVATGLAVDGHGDVWVTDGGHHRITELSPSGLPMASLGSGGCGAGRFEEPLLFYRLHVKVAHKLMPGAGHHGMSALYGPLSRQLGMVRRDPAVATEHGPPQPSRLLPPLRRSPRARSLGRVRRRAHPCHDARRLLP